MSATEESGIRLDPVGRQVLGPTALGDDAGRLWRLTYTLAATDFKLKFFGSFLGYLWQIMNPLLLFGVLFVVFSVGLGFDAGIKFYPEALLLGIVMFSFFSEATGQAVRALLTRENLVRKIDFPRLAVPMATVLTAMFNFALNLVPVLIFLIAAGGRIRPLHWLGFLLVLAGLVLLALGLAMLLSVLYVRARDIEPIWGVVMQVMFYASGVFFPLTRFGTLLRDIALCNPFAFLMAEARHMFIDPSWPSSFDLMSTPWLAVVPIALIFAALVAGFVVFRREAPRVAEEL
jgi:ABC-2 type transport system permease protein